jgi:predicted nucleic acid-binding protein
MRVVVDTNVWVSSLFGKRVRPLIPLAGGAELIVSGDKDLLELQSFRGIEILPYSEFEKRLATL